MAYNRVNWVNEEVSKTTPINAENLNKMDSGIAALDTRVDAQETAIQGKADKTDVDAKVFIAEYNVTTAQEIIAHIDASKEPFAPMLIKRGNDYYTVITAQKQSENKVIIRSFATLSGSYYVFMYTVTNGTWASSSYGFQQLLVSGTNIKTVNGESVLGSGDIVIDSYDDTALVSRVEAAETALEGKADSSSVPTKTSDLTNDSGFVDGADLENYATLEEVAKSASFTFVMENHEGTASGAALKDGTMVTSESYMGTWENNSCTFTDGTKTATLTFDNGVYTMTDPDDLFSSPVNVQGIVPEKKLSDSQVPDDVARKSDLTGKADRSEIPTMVSQLSNDANYQTDTDVAESIAGKADTADIPTNVGDLANDAGYATVPYVDSKVSAATGGLSHITEVVLDPGESLPATGADATWYLKPEGSTYEIWAYYGGAWKSLGMANAVDLSGYLKIADLPPVDNALSMTSTNAVENQAIASAFHRLSNANVKKYEIAWDKNRRAITFTDNVSGMVQELILTGVVVQ